MEDSVRNKTVPKPIAPCLDATLLRDTVPGLKHGFGAKTSPKIKEVEKRPVVMERVKGIEPSCKCW
jgi:hypothetical protein